MSAITAPPVSTDDLHSNAHTASDEAPGLDNRIFPSASTDQGQHGGPPPPPSYHHPHRQYHYHQQQHHHHHQQQPRGSEEGVEVVLEGSGKLSVVDQRPGQDQNVFRPPHPVRPRAIRGGRPPMVHGSGSYGYGHDYRTGPYPVSYGPSGSFEDAPTPYGAPPMSSSSASQYSPHGQYPPLGSRHPDHHDVNVISPNHKDHPHHGGPPPPSQHGTPGSSPHHPMTPRSSGSHSGRYGGPPPAPPSGHSTGSSYQYPPTSPVSRSPGPGSSPMRGYHGGMRRDAGGPYSQAPPRPPSSNDPAYPTPDRSNRPPLVTETSFDSEHYASHVSYASHPTTPNAPHYGGGAGGPPPATTSHPVDPHYSGGYGGSFEGGSFDGSHYNAPPSSGGYYDDRYYGHSPSHHPEGYSPYSSHSYGYSPSAAGGGGYYDPYSPHAPHYGRHPRSYDEHERYYSGYHGYPPSSHHHQYHHYPHDPYGHHYSHDEGRKKDEKSGMMLPAAASEIDFEVTDPPMEPSTPPSTQPVCDSPADVNSYDVLCGRGGGTNSQIGNRRFRQLVQEFQPIYLLARRKEKPLLARTIVLIIRKRGGRFLKKDEETGELYEVGDPKAEAKTSQALREGLDVRATKSAASSLLDKKKKKKENGANDDSPISPAGAADMATSPAGASMTSPVVSGGDSVTKDSNAKKEDDNEEKEEEPSKDSSSGSSSNGNGRSRSPQVGERRTERPSKPDSPPSLPKLHGEEQGSAAKDGESPTNAPPSPEQIQFRKRRRMRSADGGEAMPSLGCGSGLNPFSGDKLFPDFCPPRADLQRAASPTLNGHHHHRQHDDDAMEVGTTPIPANVGKYADDDIRYEQDTPGASSAAGCAGIALDMMTGAAAGSFCLGPRQWR